MLVTVEFPQLQGAVMTKAKQAYIRRTAAKSNRGNGEFMSLYMQAYTSFPSTFLLSYWDSLCGLTGRSSPVNLIYPLFCICLPPASHIFSTWQNLNLSADGVHCCFLWPVSGGTGKGWERRCGESPSTQTLKAKCGSTKRSAIQCFKMTNKSRQRWDIQHTEYTVYWSRMTSNLLLSVCKLGLGNHP